MTKFEATANEGNQKSPPRTHRYIRSCDLVYTMHNFFEVGTMPTVAFSNTQYRAVSVDHLMLQESKSQLPELLPTMSDLLRTRSVSTRSFRDLSLSNGSLNLIVTAIPNLFRLEQQIPAQEYIRLLHSKVTHFSRPWKNLLSKALNKE